MSNKQDQLFARAQSGSIDAYGTIVTDYQDMAVGFAFSILRDFHLAQDAAQEAFIEAFPILSRVHHVNAFPSWLRRVIVKQCDRMTRKDRRLVFLSAEAALVLPDRAPLPDRNVEDREMTDLLNEAIANLPAAEREAVLLFYISDHSQNEVADFLGVPVSMVKNRLRAARKRMKERLFSMMEENLKSNRPSKDDGFVEGVLKIAAPVKDHDSETIYRRLEDKGRHDMARQARNGRIADSHFDWQTSRMGLVDGRIATWIGVYTLNYQIGSAVVRAAGVNWLDLDDNVASEADLSETIADSIDAMKTNGYDIAVTRSEPPRRLAPRGFVEAMPVQESYFVDVDKLPTEKPDLEVERVHANEIHGQPELAELYNETHRGLTGAAIRPTYGRGKCPPNDEDDFPAYIFRDDAGKAVGYLYDGPFKDKAIHTHSDSAGDPEQVLRVLAEKARAFKIDQVRFLKMPYHSPLARRIRQGEYRLVTKNVDNDGRSAAMVRLIDLGSTMEKLSDLLASRLERSHLAGWSGRLAIAADDQACMLEIDGGQVNVSDGADGEHAVRGGHAVARLLIGSEAPDEVCEAGGIALSGEAPELIRVLFPAQRPQMPNEDL